MQCACIMVSKDSAKKSWSAESLRKFSNQENER